MSGASVRVRTCGKTALLCMAAGFAFGQGAPVDAGREPPAAGTATPPAQTAKPPHATEVMLICPAGEKEVKAAQEGAAAELGIPVRCTTAFGIDWILIPPGEFTMGSPDTEKGRRPNEGPQHRVKINKAFYMSVSETTQGQFRKVMGYNPSRFRGLNRPVERVSWHEAIEFCEKLSTREQKRFRLPTEAEWEYACRAGTTTRYWWGEDESEAAKHANVLDESLQRANPGIQPGFAGDDAHAETSPIRAYDANAFGLYDMIGNVWGWCQSLKKPYPYRRDDGREGTAGEGDRVLRGGSWRSYQEFCRCASRYGLDPNSKDSHVGFRMVMDIPGHP